MKRIYCYILTLVLLFTGFADIHAQKERNRGIIYSALNGLHYSVRASYGIGGISPIPLASEIREIVSYRPLVGFALEGTVEKDINRWLGLHVGLRLENKTMSTDAIVKNYKMEIENGPGATVRGYWTGNVRTKVVNSYLSIPILATFKLSQRWKMRLGPYFSYLLAGDFNGDVYDGYLREGDPTGTKVIIDADNPATYDFSDDLVRSNFGVQMGFEWRAFSHLNIFADLQWGLNSAFPKNFDTITFKMYPIYANLGFAYAF